MYNFPAEIQNTSLEFTLTTINFKRKDITWSSSLNITIPKNKMVSFLIFLVQLMQRPFNYRSTFICY